MILYVNTKTLSSNNHLVVLRKEFIITTPIFIPINYFFHSFLSWFIDADQSRNIFICCWKIKKSRGYSGIGFIHTVCTIYGEEKKKRYVCCNRNGHKENIEKYINLDLCELKFGLEQQLVICVFVWLWDQWKKLIMIN